MFDEMRGNGAAGEGIRPAYAALSDWLAEVKPDVLDFRRSEAELLFRRIGITFAVYGDPEAHERLIPFDVIPRILCATEWDLLQRGLEQRVRAINAYLNDIYHRREVLKAGIVPEDLVFQNPAFRPEMNGQKVPHDIYVHVAGIDVVRVDADTFYVLEDNARTPSGVSYMLENREIMLRLFPDCSLATASRRSRTIRTNCCRRGNWRRRRARPPSRRSSCSPPGSSIPPTTNIRFWPTSSASNWSRDAIW
jgi:uncharacterized circularly permuted ATP-grasp superfamily protein